MSYCIEYSPELGKQYPFRKSRKHKPPIKPLLTAILIAVCTYTLISTDIYKILLPGDPQITAAAFSAMVRQVQTGESVSDAVQCFFRDVIVGGMN